MKATKTIFFNSVIIVVPLYPVLIGIFVTSPICYLKVRQQVANKRQYTYPGLVGKTQTLGAIVDRKLSNDINLASITSKIIGHKLSDGSISDL